MSLLEVAEVRFFSEKDPVDHHTDRYEPVEGATFLRRGQLFNVGVRFASAYEPELHRVILEFSTGKEVRFETFGRVRVRSATDTKKKFPPPASDWGARRFENGADTAIAVQVVSPVWLPVGKWQLSVRTELAQAPGVHASLYHHPGHIYFLFNPWNKDDQTYFKDTELLNEYVLNDTGKVCNGYYTWKVWDFGQFEDCVLPAYERAIKLCKLPHHARGDPVQVTRAISLAMNSTRSGILVGRWHGKYEGGKAPYEWTGSEDILRKYLETGEPVRYGQCWVFAAIAATVCRALGIPARCVTNLGSGHDSDNSLTIDVYYDEELNESHGETIWNFHCWTDVWMRRPQLSQKNEYDGWQSIDATPQEMSKGLYQLGPAPVSAVLRGHTQVSHDVPFVFTEVNGDRVRWMRRADGKLRLIDVNNSAVGRLILTNAPMSKPNSGVLDITAEYKYPEGSVAERKSVIEAAKNMREDSEIAKRIRMDLNKQKLLNDVRFQDESPSGIHFGDNFEVKLFMKNSSKQNRTVIAELILVCVDNQGTITAHLKTSGKMKVLLTTKKNSALHTMTVSAADYAKEIQEDHFLRLIAKCRVEETGQPWLSSENFIEVYCPLLQIRIEGELSQNEEATAVIGFDRRVRFPLTRCRLAVRGSALAGGRTLVLDLPDVPERDVFSARVKIRPTRAGPQKIIAKFTSAELPKAETWLEVRVRARASTPDRLSAGRAVNALGHAAAAAADWDVILDCGVSGAAVGSLDDDKLWESFRERLSRL